jgi:hypothetical protein
MSIFDVVRSFPIDDSTMSVLAMLVGIVGGWTITSIHQQMKAKRVKLDARKRAERKP